MNMTDAGQQVVGNKLRYRCVSHLSEEQAQAILQEIDRNHRKPQQEKGPSQRINPFEVALHQQRNTWGGDQAQQGQPSLQAQQPQQAPQVQQGLERQPTQKKIQAHDQSPIKRFAKEPEVTKLNYEYVLTWYQKLAFEYALQKTTGTSVEPHPVQHSRQNTTVVVKRL